MEIITVDDLPQDVQDRTDAATLELMVKGLNARAARIAPCLLDNPTPDQIAEARMVLVGIIKRWSEAGAGAFQTQHAGPFGVTVDTRQRGGWSVWPSEIDQLQDICADRDTGTATAFSVDTAPGPDGPFHRPWCALAFGADHCSCGADIAGEPIYEFGTPG